MAEQTLKNNGLYGWGRKLKAMGLPEGALVGNVETWYNLCVKGIIQNPAADSAERAKIAAAAIASIENHRKRFVPGEANYPDDLYEYIWYRMKLEIRHLHHGPPEEMGLNKEVVRVMTEKAYTYWKSQIATIRKKYQ